MNIRRTFFLSSLCLMLPLCLEAQTPQRPQGQAPQMPRSRSIYSPKMQAYYNAADSMSYAALAEKPLIGVTSASAMKGTCSMSIELSGGMPVYLPFTTDVKVIDEMVSKLDGILFTGGEDVDPAWYGAERSEKCQKPNAERDAFEILLFKKATDHNLPVLGLCRGSQMINVAMGGTLYQDIPSEHPSQIVHGKYDNSREPAHQITTVKGSLMEQIYGETAGVNSLHHQGIQKLAPGLKVTAWSPDSIPEAIEADSRQIWATQFHPEVLASEGDPTNLKLFQFFVSQAKLFHQAKDIHSRILSVDTHCDTPMNFSRGGSVALRSERQQVSVQRMQEGFLDAQFLAAFLSQRDETPESLAKALSDCQNIIDNIYKDVNAHQDVCGIAVTVDDALRLKAEGKRAFFIGIENGFGLGGDIANIKKFKDQGVGYITLCHSADNGICNSSTRTADENKGLTAFGKKVVKEMNKYGVLIDLSHASMGTFWDVMKYSKLPVICSHSGAKDVYFHNRNLNDDQLRALAKNGGVIQVCIFASYMSADASKTNLDDVVAHIMHCVDVAGIDHVGVGSDFDGGGGVVGLNGSNNMIRITEKLLEHGYSEEDIAKIWGGNFFRVLSENQAAAK